MIRINPIDLIVNKRRLDQGAAFIRLRRHSTLVHEERRSPMQYCRLGRTAHVGPRARLRGYVRHVWASDRPESMATIHAALDAGITLLETGDFYRMGQARR